MQRIKNLALLLPLLFFVSALLSAPLAAQGPRFLIPEKIERTTQADDDGVEQWTEWKGVKGPSCKGTGKSVCVTCARFPKDAKDCPECGRKDDKLLATCRVCIGTGELPDPLISVPCAGCMGSGVWVCTVCGGSAKIKVGAAKRWSKCPACRGAGGFPCRGCKGKRVMSGLQLKPTILVAGPDKLKKTIKGLERTAQLFAKFTPIGGTKARKAVKELTAAFDSAKKMNPAFKDLGKQAKDYMGKIFAGANFQGHEENEQNTMTRIKTHAEYYLKHQARILDLALKRAEHNAEKDGK